LAVAGVDWLVVVVDFGVPAGADCGFCADGVELDGEAAGEDVDGATDEFRTTV
jgi:hypothetical protein